MENKYLETSRIFKALCDPNRLMIIEMLQSGDRCACKLLKDLNIVQSTLSHHMKILYESGFVNCSRCGKWMYYSLNQSNFEVAKQILESISKNHCNVMMLAQRTHNCQE